MGIEPFNCSPIQTLNGSCILRWLLEIVLEGTFVLISTLFFVSLL